MEVPKALLAAIESTHVAFEGLSHPLRLTDAVRERDAMRFTVETTHAGQTFRAVCRFAVDRLSDEKYVVTSLADTLRAILSGELAPDGIRNC